MFRCLLALSVFFALPVSASAADTDPPADICVDLERLASEFDEALLCLTRDDVLRTELDQLIAELRFHAIRCANANCGLETQLSDWATRFEHAGTNRYSLRAVLDEMTFRLDMLWLRRTIEEIQLNQLRVHKAIVASGYDNFAPNYDQGRTEPAIGEVPLLLVVAPNSTVKVRHSLRWRQYAEDTLTVELVCSSSEIVAPAKLTLDFEKHQLEFEYEVRVGAPGDYCIRLIPTVGQPVLVSISVK